MAYSADIFVADEVPTTSKWNKLWNNDASFNDGTGIASGAITAAKISTFDKSLLTGDSNPYKFSAYRAAANTTSNSGAVVQYDTELYDSNSNFDITTNKGRYTAPVSGFYHFEGQHGNSAATGTIMYCWIAVNGVQKIVGNVSSPSVANNTHRVSGDLQLNANDYVEIYFIGGAGSVGAVGQVNSYFMGHFISRT